MLIAKNMPAFDSPDHFYELKFDGMRALAYMDGDYLELRNKRNKSITATFPELAGISKQANKRCILDGEIIVMSEGKPDFSQLQRRALTSNTFKARISADALPASFVAFDIIFAGASDLTRTPLSTRKEILENAISPSGRLAVSKITLNQGIALYNAAERGQLEGIVAKRKDSLYYYGKRTHDWIKCKSLQDEDFIAVGYYRKSMRLTSVILGTIAPSGAIVYRGHAVMGVSSDALARLSAATRSQKSAYPSFPDFPSANWLVPQLVCIVNYMELTNRGGLRQPVFKGFRDDKSPSECVSSVVPDKAMVEIEQLDEY
jgi:DNA ligase D-like protein (predicted ligase)